MPKSLKECIFLKIAPGYEFTEADQATLKLVSIRQWVELIYKYKDYPNKSVKDLLKRYMMGEIRLAPTPPPIHATYEGLDIYSHHKVPKFEKRSLPLVSEIFHEAVLLDTPIYERATTWYLFEGETCITRVDLLHSGTKALRLVVMLAEPKKVFEVTEKFRRWLFSEYGLTETYYIMPNEGTCGGIDPDWSGAIVEDLGSHKKYRYIA